LDGLFLALAIGLFSSAAEQERFRAVRTALSLLTLIILLPFLLYLGLGRGLFFYMGLFSPLVLLLRAGDSAYTTSPGLYWSSLLAVHLAGWGILIYTGFRLRRAVTRDNDGRDLLRLSSERNPRAIALGTWQPLKTEATPVEWLVYRRYGVHAGIWALTVVALACNVWIPLVRQARGVPPGAFFLAVASPLGTIAGLVGAAMVAWVASRFFIGTRRSGDLELLLTTPVGAQTVLEDQWRVLKRFFVWPALCLQAPMLPQLLLALSGRHGSAGAGHGVDLLALQALTVANVFFGTAALCWLGLWFGLRARTQAGAIVYTAGLGKGLPTLFALGCSLFSGGPTNARALPQHGILVWWLPQLGALAFYVWLVIAARTSLRAGLAGQPLPTLFETGKSR
jgi:hypothetical protein